VDAPTPERDLVRIRGRVDGDRLRLRGADHVHPHHHDPLWRGSAAHRIFALWPFGKTVVRRADAGAGSAIGNVLWFVLAGWWLIIGHLVTGVLLCLTIIGIPLGLANFKLIPVTLRPFGRDIVSIEEAERQGLLPAPAAIEFGA
jgi:hypothetical protein